MKEEILKEVKKEQKKNFKKTIVLVITTAILFGTVGVAAGSFTAKQITFRPSDSTWKVNNVSDAIDDLKFKKVSNNYSTEEQIVGTWTDGKPVYQKTYYGIANTNDFSVVLENNFGASKKIVSTDANLISTDNQFISLGYINSNWFLAIHVNVSKNLLLCYGSALKGGEYIATLQYTKTTDSANNG